MYGDFLRFLKINVIVFDGYSLSTKDVTHQKRSGKLSTVVEVKEVNNCPTDWNTFLTNYLNKGAFVSSLSAYLRSRGFQVIEWPSDANTTIVKATIDIAKDQNVVVYSDDTVLLHHFFINRSNMKDNYLTNMTRQKDQARTCYSIRDIIEKTEMKWKMFSPVSYSHIHGI